MAKCAKCIELGRKSDNGEYPEGTVYKQSIDMYMCESHGQYSYVPWPKQSIDPVNQYRNAKSELIPLKFEKTASESPCNQKAKKWVDLIKSRHQRIDQSWMYIYGETGSYKTTLALQCGDALLKHFIRDKNDTDFEAEYITEPDLMRQISSWIGDDKAGRNPVEDYLEPNLLIFDEFGAAKHSDWTKQHVADLIDNRYRRGLPTIIVSNFSPSQLKSARKIDDNRTRSSHGQHVVGRIMEMCDGGSRVIRLSGNSRI